MLPLPLLTPAEGTAHLLSRPGGKEDWSNWNMWPPERRHRDGQPDKATAGLHQARPSGRGLWVVS